VLSANHFIVDAFAGLVVCLAGLALAWAMQRWFYPWCRSYLAAPSPMAGRAGAELEIEAGA
jgi:hypothetical protein